MQQPPESTPPPAALTPPTLDPARWEDFNGYRETFLVYFPDPVANASLRRCADLYYQLILESPLVMPEQPEGWVRSQIRAAVADLRFLQGFLSTLGDEADTSNTPHEEHLCRFAGARAEVIGKAADEIDAQLGAWRGEDRV
jgi:hypothetical protein